MSAVEHIKTEDYEGPERRRFYDYRTCPLKDIHDKDIDSILDRLHTLRDISDTKDLEERNARNILMQRLEKFEEQTDERFEKLDNKIDNLAGKLEGLENNLCKKIGDAINNLFGKIMKWVVVAVIGSGLIYYFRPLIAKALQAFFGV